MTTKNFLKYVIPSMFAFAISGIYVIIDGIFVGRNTGDIGLAAVNINYPIASLMQALGTGIGMAGGILISIERGQNHKQNEGLFLGNSLLLLWLSSLLLMVILLVAYPLLLPLLGAEGDLLGPSHNYLRIIIYGSLFQVLATGFLPLVRNYKGVILAMVAMVAGLVINTLLDYLFIQVLAWGTGGAAAATVLGQAATCLILLPYFFWPRPLCSWSDLRPKSSIILKILPLARSPFGLTLVPNLIVIILNKSSLYYGGIVALSTYSIISYVIYIVQLFLQGIGDGAQPLISHYFGQNSPPTLKKIRHLSYILSLIIALFSCLFLYLTRHQLPIWFGSSPQVADLYSRVLSYFLIGTLFASMLRVCTSYLYAINQSRQASILIYGEPLVLLALILYGFPWFFRLDGVWLAVPISQLLMMVLSLYYIRLSLPLNPKGK